MSGGFYTTILGIYTPLMKADDDLHHKEVP
jgi:hypothetical protein